MSNLVLGICRACEWACYVNTFNLCPQCDSLQTNLLIADAQQQERRDRQ